MRKRLDKESAQARKKAKLLEKRRLAEWDDAMMAGSGAAACMVVIKGLFAPEEVEAMEDVADFYANLKQDITVEARKAGEVDKVTLFEGSEQGAAAVKFKLADDAQAWHSTAQHSTA